MPRVGDQQDHPPDRPGRAASARTRRSSACRSSRRVSASTISSTFGPSITTSALRRSPGIGTGTSARHRSTGPDALAKSFDEGEVGGVANRRSGRIQTDAQVEAKYRCHRRDPIYRHPLQLASLEAADGGVGQARRPGPDGPLTQARGQSSSDATPRQPADAAADPSARRAGGRLRGFPCGIVSRGRLSWRSTGVTRRPQVWRHHRSNGRPKA